MDEKNYERILAWLENAMSPSERAAFEDEMQSDPVLAEEAKLARAALQAPQEEEVLALRRQLDEIMSSEPLPSGNPSRLGGKVLVAILLLLGLVLLFFFFQKNQNAPKPKPIGPVAAFEKYFAQPDHELQLTALQEGSRNEVDEDSLLREAEGLAVELNQQLTAQRPGEVLALIGQIEASDSLLMRFPKVRLLLIEGVALLQTDQPEAAIQIFDEIGEIRYDELAQWYRAGALLALEREDEAATLLREIADLPAHPKRDAARKLLDEISGE